MRGRRSISPGLREDIARKQARYMQMFGDNDWKIIDKAIQSKGDDYYRSELFADDKVMAQAMSDFDGFRTGTPAMNQVADDMRAYYGLTPSAPLPTSSPAPAPAAAPPPPPPAPAPAPAPAPVAAKAFKEKKVAEVKEVMFGPEPPPAKVEDDLIMQQQVAAAEQQQQQINSFITQAQKELKPKGWFIDDPYLETALMAAAALGTGGIIGRASAPEEEEEPIYRLQ